MKRSIGIFLAAALLFLTACVGKTASESDGETPLAERGKVASTTPTQAQTEAKTEVPTAALPSATSESAPKASATPPVAQQTQINQNSTAKTEARMIITIDDKNFYATLADTEAAKAFSALLPLEIEMTELNGNEKYAYLDRSLPNAPQKPDMIREGDIMLYGSSCIVLFYESFSTGYTYTRIAHIDNAEGLKQALGKGAATVRFSLE